MVIYLYLFIIFMYVFICALCFKANENWIELNKKTPLQCALLFFLLLNNDPAYVIDVNVLRRWITNHKNPILRLFIYVSTLACVNTQHWLVWTYNTGLCEHTTLACVNTQLTLACVNTQHWLVWTHREWAAYDGIYSGNS